MYAVQCFGPSALYLPQVETGSSPWWSAPVAPGVVTPCRPVCESSYLTSFGGRVYGELTPLGVCSDFGWISGWGDCASAGWRVFWPWGRTWGAPRFAFQLL